MLVVEGLSFECISLLLLELLNSDPVLDVGLSLLEVLQLGSTLALFLSFLLLSHLQLFVTVPPEVSKVALLLLFSCLLSCLSLDLQLTASLDSCLHLGFALLLLLVKSVSTVLSFGDLPVQNFLLVVLKSA